MWSRRHSGQRNDRARGSTRLVKQGVKQNVCMHGNNLGIRNLSKQIGHVVRRSIWFAFIVEATVVIILNLSDEPAHLSLLFCFDDFTKFQFFCDHSSASCCTIDNAPFPEQSISRCRNSSSHWMSERSEQYRWNKERMGEKNQGDNWRSTPWKASRRNLFTMFDKSTSFSSLLFSTTSSYFSIIWHLCLCL